MDEVDFATLRMEQEDEFRRRKPQRPELPPKGTCYFCCTDVEHPKKFCDKDCADDFEFAQRMLKRNGK